MHYVRARGSPNEKEKKHNIQRNHQQLKYMIKCKEKRKQLRARLRTEKPKRKPNKIQTSVIRKYKLDFIIHYSC